MIKKAVVLIALADTPLQYCVAGIVSVYLLIVFSVAAVVVSIFAVAAVPLLVLMYPIGKISSYILKKLVDPDEG